MDVRFGGGQELDDLARRFRAAAGSDKLLEGMRPALSATVPVVQAAVAEGASRLPERGGLARLVARTIIDPQFTVERSGVRLRFVARENAVKDPGALDRGRARHLTYGHKPWVIQKVAKGWFSDPVRALAPRIRTVVVKAITEQFRKV